MKKKETNDIHCLVKEPNGKGYDLSVEHNARTHTTIARGNQM